MREKNRETLSPTESVVEFGFWRPGGTYNDPRTLIVEAPEDCHRLCDEDDQCLSWSRDRVSGACALKDRESPFVSNVRFDSGVIGGVPAVGVVEAGPCFVESRRIYRKGTVLRRTRTSTADACCTLCRNDPDCFSWHRSRRNGRCVLNQNIPQAKRRAGFDGAALI